jgi:RNA polymerase sigma-70 factor (ECF subfamily)
MGQGDPDDAAKTPGGLETTQALLRRVAERSPGAADELVRRFLPPLRRFAHRRLPPHLRGLAETDDLVQVSLLRALERVTEFESRHPGAFLGYLRRILDNHLHDLRRRAARRPEVALDPEDLDREPARDGGEEAAVLYRETLSRLSEEDRMAVVLRLEMGFTHEEVAEALALPSAAAARMRVVRALVRMTEERDGR